MKVILAFKWFLAPKFVYALWIARMDFLWLGRDFRGEWDGNWSWGGTCEGGGGV